MKTFFQSLELNSVDFLHCWIWLPINWNLGSFLLFGVRNIPRRYIFPGATYPPALHIPRRYISPGATYSPAPHIPGASYSPALHIPWCPIFLGATYSPALHIPRCYISPGATYPLALKTFVNLLVLRYLLAL